MGTSRDGPAGAGPVLVREVLEYSLNIPAIRAYQRVGETAVADVVEALGIRPQGGRKLPLEAWMSAAVGTVEVRPLDLASAYGTIANSGVVNLPQDRIRRDDEHSRVRTMKPLACPSCGADLQPGSGNDEPATWRRVA